MLVKVILIKKSAFFDIPFSILIYGMACENVVFSKKEAVYNITSSKILGTRWINPVFLLDWQVTYLQFRKGVEDNMGL